MEIIIGIISICILIYAVMWMAQSLAHLNKIRKIQGLQLELLKEIAEQQDIDTSEMDQDIKEALK